MSRPVEPMPAILPCPKCGDTRAIERSNIFARNSLVDPVKVAVVCQHCNHFRAVFASPGADAGRLRRDAIEAWNREARAIWKDKGRDFGYAVTGERYARHNEIDTQAGEEWRDWLRAGESVDPPGKT